MCRQKPTITLFLLIFIVIFTTACTQENEQYIIAHVTRVVDGDTIKVDINGRSESVRFLLIDTPELGKHPQPFAEEAKNFTEKLLDDNTVLLEKDVSERDKYGRLLMYVYTSDGKSVQEELLKEGLARVAYVYAPNTKYVVKYYALQKEAQHRGVGIWSIENYVQEDGYNPEALIDEHEGESRETTTSFPPDANGDCHGKIKGNRGSNGWIYHLPDGAHYHRTKAEECFDTEQAAISAGYRKSSR